jgi:hypothetical protein
VPYRSLNEMRGGTDRQREERRRSVSTMTAASR